MSLFRKSEEKVAQEKAAQAEVDRLMALPVDDLAAELLPAFGPEGIPHSGGGIRPQELCKWLLASYPRSFWINPGQLLMPVREGLQALEHANLLSSAPYERMTIWRITRLGDTALAEGKTRQYLRDEVNQWTAR